jgi:hypothetical protein
MSEGEFTVGGHKIMIYTAPKNLLALCTWQEKSGQSGLSFSDKGQAVAIINEMANKAEGRFATVGNQWVVDDRGADNKIGDAYLLSPKQFSFDARDFPVKKTLESMQAYAERLENFVKTRVDQNILNALVTLRVFKAAGKDTLKVNYEATTSVLIKYGDAWFLINDNKWAQINSKPTPPMQMHAVPQGHGMHNVLHAFPAPEHH